MSDEPYWCKTCNCMHGYHEECPAALSASSLAAPTGWASRVPLDEIATSSSELLRKLSDGDLPPRPFWLEIGKAGYRITDENRGNIAHGMLLCLDVQQHRAMMPNDDFRRGDLSAPINPQSDPPSPARTG